MRSGNKTKALGVLNTSFTLFLRQVAKKPTLGLTKLVGKPSLSTPINEKFNPKPLPIRKVKVNSTPSLCDKLESFKKTQKNLSLTFQEKKNHIIPESILSTLVENVRPCIEIRKVRVARATYQVPAQISKTKGQTQALRWIIEFANKRKLSDGTSFAQALAQELKLAHKKQGSARERRSQLHRLAQANRSYMRYRWW